MLRGRGASGACTRVGLHDSLPQRGYDAVVALKPHLSACTRYARCQCTPQGPSPTVTAEARAAGRARKTEQSCADYALCETSKRSNPSRHGNLL